MRPRFTVLGPVRVLAEGRELALAAPQRQAILAILLLRRRRPVTVTEIIEGVWGADAPPRAVGVVRTQVSRLRGLLEPDRSARGAGELLVSVGDGYAMAIQPDALDLEVFEGLAAEAEACRESDPVRARNLLREALALWNGEALTGVPGPHAELARARLADRRLAALETRLELDLALGDHAAAAPELRVLTGEHPLRERFRALLMLALYRRGQQADALEVYTATRRTLVEDLGIEPGPDLADLHRRILSGDPTLMLRREPAARGSAGPGAAATLVPAQLPADAGDFSARTALTAQLKEVLCGAERTVALTAVSGLGGVGKSVFAIHVAHAVRAHFPDGQLYVDLRGTTDDPAEPAAVLAGFLRALGVPDQDLPKGLAERSALYRSLLADRRMLVLLDNARDSAALEPLLPGTPGCAALITSRVLPADLAGVRHVVLDVLEPGEALELFTRIVGSERVEAERAAALDTVAACGFHPLAVRIVAARLSARPSWMIATLAARLADDRRRLSELRLGDLAVEATFASCLRQLTDEQARAFRLLAVADVPDLSLPAAAALLDRPPREAEDLLESLVDTALVESPVAGRYRCHDLVRLYGRRRAEEDAPHERIPALARLLDFALASARNAYRALAPGDTMTGCRPPTQSAGTSFTDHRAVTRWLLVERAGLVAMVARSVADFPEQSAGLLLALVRLAEVYLAQSRPAEVSLAVSLESRSASARQRLAIDRGHELVMDVMTRAAEAVGEDPDRYRRAAGDILARLDDAQAAEVREVLGSWSQAAVRPGG